MIGAGLQTGRRCSVVQSANGSKNAFDGSGLPGGDSKGISSHGRCVDATETLASTLGL